MNIVDKNGQVMTIENLDLAILQADDYRQYRHHHPSFKTLDEGLQAYWEDVCLKLLRLKNE
ncbi:hypothetical protein PQ469_24940 [Mucilaginibacter sp. KACC 22773]|uniref:hypothetical protein n=1 Tax=Mucilaginibacter sp. KACC 22773 TaxID=3025671 RepID=UPI002365D734|nr:hypothetical protein [Mucilaginibacter sp. KACC 22773]WDF77136.1 hypothetical protein PQ469_24940 [Mucilaginibacter sp. KACC 22773]